MQISSLDALSFVFRRWGTSKINYAYDIRLVTKEQQEIKGSFTKESKVSVSNFLIDLAFDIIQLVTSRPLPKTGETPSNHRRKEFQKWSTRLWIETHKRSTWFSCASIETRAQQSRSGE